MTERTNKPHLLDTSSVLVLIEDEAAQIVRIKLIGLKVGNRVLVEGKEIQLNGTDDEANA